MTISITPAALAHFKKYLKSRQQGIRFDIVKSGCSGYRYTVTPIDENNPATEQDKVFLLDAETQLQLYVSRKIYPKVMGTVIDYQKKGLGGGELVYDNPQQTGACGCGESVALE